MRYKIIFIISFLVLNIGYVWGTTNLIQNSSFELGFVNWGRGPDVLDDVRWDIDGTTAYHGKDSLRLYSGIGAYRVEVQSSPFSVVPGKQYTLSFWAKSDIAARKIKAGFFRQDEGEIMSCEFYLEKEWRRYNIKCIMPKNMSNLNYMAIKVLHDSATIWVDAVQVEEGELTQYHPYEGVEIGITTDKFGNIFGEKEEILVNIALGNNTDRNREVTIDYKIQDYDGEVIKEDKEEFNIKQGETSTYSFKLSGLEKGYYLGDFKLSEDGIFVKGQWLRIAVINRRKYDKQYPDSPFGLQWVAAGLDWQHAVEAGAKFCRTPIYWQHHEPKKGVYNWTDYYTDTLQPTQLKYNLGLLIVTGWPTDWSQAKGEMAVADYEAEREFFKKAAQRYKDRIKYWESWNEISMYIFNVNDFFYYQKAFYEGIKAGNPNAKVAFNLILWFSDIDKWLKPLLEMGIAKYMDILSFHYYYVDVPYTGRKRLSPEDEVFEETISRMRESLDSYNGKHIDIWLSEWGYESENDPYLNPSVIRSNAKEQTEHEQAQYMVRTHLMALSNNIKKIFYYIPGAESVVCQVRSGMIRTDGTPKPVYAAYSHMTELLEGTKSVERLDLQDVIRFFVFEKEKDNHYIVAFYADRFAERGIIKLTLPAKKLIATNIVGKNISLISSNTILSFDGDVRYIECIGINRQELVSSLNNMELSDLVKRVPPTPPHLLIKKNKIVLPPKPECDIYIEGENATSHNFTVGYLWKRPGCYNGTMLLLDGACSLPTNPGYYYASYEVDIPSDGDYRLMVAGWPIAAGWTSPAWISVDEGKEEHVKWTQMTEPWCQEEYGGPGGNWMDLGKIHMNEGKHMLKFKVNEPRTDGTMNAYLIGIDAIALKKE